MLTGNIKKNTKEEINKSDHNEKEQIKDESPKILSHNEHSQKNIKPQADIMFQHVVEPTQQNQGIKIMEYNDHSIIVTLLLKKIFSFYDVDRKLIGSFDIGNLFKYIAHFTDRDNKFMPNLNISEGKKIIETFVCFIIPQNVYGQIDIRIHDYSKSQFMSHIDILICLYKMFKNHYTNDFAINISSVTDKNEVELIRKNVKLFGFILVEHILQVMADLSNQLKNDPTNVQQRSKIIRYCIGLVHEGTKYVNTELIELRNNYTLLTNGIEEIKNIENTIKQKLDQT